MKKKKRWIAVLFSMILFVSILSPASISAASNSAVPAKVTIAKISASPSRKVTLSWKKTARATGYRIYYKQYGARSWKYISSTTGTSYTHISTSKCPLTGGKKYTYVVRGYNKYSRKQGPYDKKGRTITVPLRVSQIKLNRTSLAFNKKGSSYRLSASVLPRNATNRSIIWKSSNPKAATVNGSGKVTAVSNGTTVITVSARDGSGKKATCKVTVRIQSEASRMASQVLNLVNKERKKAGLPLLKAYVPGDKAAMNRAKEINQLFDHIRPNGSSCFSILSEYNIHSWASGENIAAGYSHASTPQGVMNLWMNSPGHRANILNSSFTHLCVGFYRSNGKSNWVQIFLRNPVWSRSS